MLDPPTEHIDSLSGRDVPAASQLLCEVFAGSIWSDLGPAVARELLASFVALPSGVGFVCRRDDTVLGFVVGTDDAPRHRTTLVRRRWWALTVRALGRVPSSPGLLWRLPQYVHPYVSSARRHAAHRPDIAPEVPLPSASLILLGVAPEHRRRGIAERLSGAFLEEMARREVPQVKLAVGANNHAALAFYRAQGWRRAGFFSTPGGELAYRLIYDLRAAVPGEPVHAAGRFAEPPDRFGRAERSTLGPGRRADGAA